MGKGYKRMLAPPDYVRRVDVTDAYVKDRLAEGFRIDEFPDDRETILNALPDKHKGRCAIVLGCGPSCKTADLGQLIDLHKASGAVALATNNVWEVMDGRAFPSADYLVTLDEEFWGYKRSEVASYLRDNPFCLPVLGFEPNEALRFMRVHIDIAVEAQSVGAYQCGAYFFGKSSGIAAIQLAFFSGIRDVMLLGHDLCSHQGNSHGYGPRRREEVVESYPQGKEMFSGYAVLARHAAEIGARVVNMSQISAIDCFPRSTVAEELARFKKPKGKR
jgi:hypothetical protein